MQSAEARPKARAAVASPAQSWGPQCRALMFLKTHQPGSWHETVRGPVLCALRRRLPGLWSSTPQVPLPRTLSACRLDQDFAAQHRPAAAPEK